MARTGTPHPHPAALLQDAVALHRQGRLDEAERLYNRVLKIDRRHFDALHLLGVLNQQRGKTGEAYRLLTAALKIQPRSPDALSHLGMVLHGAAPKRGGASDRFARALEIAPDHLDALQNRGTVRLGDSDMPGGGLSDFDQVLAARSATSRGTDQSRQCAWQTRPPPGRHWPISMPRSRFSRIIRRRSTIAEPRSMRSAARPRRSSRSSGRWRWCRAMSGLVQSGPGAAIAQPPSEAHRKLPQGARDSAGSRRCGLCGGMPRF